jgi:hypothetical protein
MPVCLRGKNLFALKITWTIFTVYYGWIGDGGNNPSIIADILFHTIRWDACLEKAAIDRVKVENSKSPRK